MAFVEVWTARRVAEVIHRTFGVSYHRDHVSRLLREAGWSRQQPVQRATQRDEQAIKDWYERRWPAIKKSGRGRTHDRRGATKLAFISSQWRCALGHYGERRQCCVSH